MPSHWSNARPPVANPTPRTPPRMASKALSVSSCRTKTSTLCAQRGAYPKLPTTGGATGEQKVGHVDASHEKQPSHRCQKHYQLTADTADHKRYLSETFEQTNHYRYHGRLDYLLNDDNTLGFMLNSNPSHDREPRSAVWLGAGRWLQHRFRHRRLAGELAIAAR